MKGGLGNQLFCYAAARRLSFSNNCELLIDNVSGFVRDKKYRGTYALSEFPIIGRIATAEERMEPFERVRRGFAKGFGLLMPYRIASYVSERGKFDARLLDLDVDHNIYIDGLWQSERYFQDIKLQLAKEVLPPKPSDKQNLETYQEICAVDSVALHIRRFDRGSVLHGRRNLPFYYYQAAVNWANQIFDSPKFFVFSDDPSGVAEALTLDKKKTRFVTHNTGREGATADMWLMSNCKAIVIANSTFSWWSAWIGSQRGNRVLAPLIKFSDPPGGLRFRAEIPSEWHTVEISKHK